MTTAGAGAALLVEQLPRRLPACRRVSRRRWSRASSTSPASSTARREPLPAKQADERGLTASAAGPCNAATPDVKALDRATRLRAAGGGGAPGALAPRPGSLGSRRQGEMTMTEEDVRKAWSMVRRAAERLAEEAARLETAATGDGLRDASLLAAQRSARDLLDVHLGAVGRHYDRVLRDRLTRRAEDDVED